MLNYYTFKLKEQDGKIHSHVYSAESWTEVLKVYPKAIFISEIKQWDQSK